MRDRKRTKWNRGLLEYVLECIPVERETKRLLSCVCAFNLRHCKRTRVKRRCGHRYRISEVILVPQAGSINGDDLKIGVRLKVADSDSPCSC